MRFDENVFVFLYVPTSRFYCNLRTIKFRPCLAAQIRINQDKQWQISDPTGPIWRWGPWAKNFFVGVPFGSAFQHCFFVEKLASRETTRNFLWNFVFFGNCVFILFFARIFILYHSMCLCRVMIWREVGWWGIRVPVHVASDSVRLSQMQSDAAWIFFCTLGTFSKTTKCCKFRLETLHFYIPETVLFQYELQSLINGGDLISQSWFEVAFAS